MPIARPSGRRDRETLLEMQKSAVFALLLQPKSKVTPILPKSALFGAVGRH
jgi:hypothetical protein